LGRARPSTRTLQVIAERLQRPIEYFLQDPEHSSVALELVLIEAASRLKQGDAASARELMTGFSARSNVSPEMRVRAGLLLGGAPREAIAGYQAAIAAAEHLLDMQALGGIYEGLAMSFQRTGDLTHALEYAQRSLRLFETLQDVRMSAQLRNNMAEILLQQHR